MKTILIKNITLPNGSQNDVLIAEGKFEKIAPNIAFAADKTLDGKEKALVPAFYNAHTHAAMSLLRSFSEGKSLREWLSDIWKRESTLTYDDIYNGTRLAIIEMLRSGTVFFADMYWHHEAVIAAVRDMGIRANIGVTFMDNLDSKTLENNIKFIESFKQDALISLSIAPHAIYTCGQALYKRCFDLAEKHNLHLHTHVSETRTEVNDCLKANGLTPVQYLAQTGVLSERTIAAHCVHLTPFDADVLAEKGVMVVHNPCSNMKLASGIFPYQLLKSANVRIALGTDGNASNNSLSMLKEMKFGSLLAKVSTDDSAALPAEEIFQWATENSASAFGLKAGRISEGYLADCLLLNLNNVSLVPNNNLIASLVYSAESECIDSVICNGTLLMENRHIYKECEVVERAKKCLL